VTQNGFNNCFNMGIRSQVSTPFGLFAGVANPFGPEVAVRRHAGWTYEKNPQSGLEIWLGSPDYRPPREPRVHVDGQASREASGMPASRPPVLPSTVMLEGIIARFYGDRGYRHTGYWTCSTKSATAACDNLADEVAAFLRERNEIRSIVEVASRAGATTERLSELLAGTSITVVESERHPPGTGGFGTPRGDSRYTAQVRSSLPREPVDAVVWVAGFAPLGNRLFLTRWVHGLLRNGGHLACFDLVPERPDPTAPDRSAGLERTSGPQSLEGYRALLAEVGFDHIRIIDVTKATLRECRRRLASSFAMEQLSGRCKEIRFSQVQDFLERYVAPARHGLLISARKPRERDDGRGTAGAQRLEEPTPSYRNMTS
jgi:hypothetical protein